MSENIFQIQENEQTNAIIQSALDGENSIEFLINDKVVLGLYEDGSIFVHGRLAETDKEVVDGVRKWLKQINNL